MKRALTVGILAVPCLLAAGCSTSHLLFVENSHMGLKASFEPNNPTPAEIDIGWRRAVVAMVPKKSAQADKNAQADQQPKGDKTRTAEPSGSVTVTTSDDTTTGGKKTLIEIVPDPNELMSMYAVYKGNIGFGDPIDIYHFMATGVAASNLLANQGELRDLVKHLDVEKK